MAQASNKFLNAFERKVLRKVIVAILEDNRWWIRYNKELYCIYDDPEVSKLIKLERLKWVGHVQRIGNMRISEIIFKSNIDLSGSVGKPPPKDRKT